MIASLAVFALTAVAPAFGTPMLEARKYQYNLYNNGSRGSVSNLADDFSATYHTSAFMSRQGCSSTVSISQCYAAELSSNPKQMLETMDYKPYIVGGVGTNQRALLLSELHRNTSGIVTHKVRFHISTGYTAVPAGLNNSVTFVGLRNLGSKVGVKALDVRARTFLGEDTSGTYLYVAAVNQDDSQAYPTSYSLKDALGKTIEVTYRLGVNGATVDKDKVFVADVTAKFVKGGAKLFSVGVTKTMYPKGVVDPKAHRLIFGADRKASSGMKQLKVWFGDYTVTPLPISSPE